MYTFLLLAIPCLLLFYLSSPLAKGSYWLAFCTGFFPALCYAAIDEFFIFTVHRFTDSLAACYLHLLAKDILIPALAPCALYALLSRREAEDRAFALLVVLSGCYMAYLPYEVITGAERFSPFLCLAKPLLVGSAIATFSLSCRGLCACIRSKRKGPAAACVPGILLAPALPPLAESVWQLNGPAGISGGITAALLVLAVLASVFLCESERKTLDKSI